MRKVLLTVLLAASVSTLFAQKLDDIKEKIQKGKYDEAKEKVDKVLADPKAQTNSEAWFYKASVYQNLAKANPADTTLSLAAFEAMKKYLSLEESKPAATRNLLSTLENNRTVFDIYQTYFNNGVTNFKSKAYPAAYYDFNKTLETFDFLQKNNFTTVKFDTTATIYAALSAHNAKDFPNAANYYQRLVDIRIPDTTYIDAYEFLISYYLSEKKDTATAEKYLHISEQVFPKRNWLDYELSLVPNEKNARLARYEELLARYPDNSALLLQYSVDQYNHAFIYEGAKPADYVARKAKAKQALQNTIQADPNNPLANYIMSQYVNNEIYDLEDELRAVKGTTAADLAKKKDINARMDAQYEDLFKYSNKAYELYGAEATMRAQDKVNYRKSINSLIDYYTRKKQTDKVTMYQEKLKTLK